MSSEVDWINVLQINALAVELTIVKSLLIVRRCRIMRVLPIQTMKQIILNLRLPAYSCTRRSILSHKNKHVGSSGEWRCDDSIDRSFIRIEEYYCWKFWFPRKATSTSKRSNLGCLTHTRKMRSKRPAKFQCP